MEEGAIFFFLESAERALDAPAAVAPLFELPDPDDVGRTRRFRGIFAKSSKDASRRKKPEGCL